MNVWNAKWFFLRAANRVPVPSFTTFEPIRTLAGHFTTPCNILSKKETGLNLKKRSVLSGHFITRALDPWTGTRFVACSWRAYALVRDTVTQATMFLGAWDRWSWERLEFTVGGNFVVGRSPARNFEKSDFSFCFTFYRNSNLVPRAFLLFLMAEKSPGNEIAWNRWVSSSLYGIISVVRISLHFLGNIVKLQGDTKPVILYNSVTNHVSPRTRRKLEYQTSCSQKSNSSSFSDLKLLTENCSVNWRACVVTSRSTWICIMTFFPPLVRRVDRSLDVPTVKIIVVFCSYG